MKQSTPDPLPPPSPARQAAGAEPQLRLAAGSGNLETLDGCGPPTRYETGPNRFHSILFETPEDRGPEEPPDAPLFRDLSLDQVIDAATSGRQEYDLKPLFRTPLKNCRAINYRHEVMQDLATPELLSQVQSFAQKMRAMRLHRAQADQLRNIHQKQAAFLDAVEVYCEAVTTLADALAGTSLKSRGFRAFRNYLQTYVASAPFRSLLADTRRVKTSLASVKYCILVRANSFTVRRYDGEPDYSVEVERTFERFKLDAPRNYAVRFHDSPEMNHIEEKILEFVANLYPDTFRSLEEYHTAYSDYLDETVQGFDREVQFYLAWGDYLSSFTREGLSVCYPEMSEHRKDIYATNVFDLALAKQLLGTPTPVVCNDFYLTGDERILIVTGPNQGGKTTFARTFGQLHYLARIGCTIPGTAARLFLCDRIFTHFEREERLDTLHGALEDSLARIHHILGQATPNSIVILNEIFTSTTLRDALWLSKKVLTRIMELDLLCVCVTFIDELAFLSPKTVSMVATVVPEHPSMRTYRLARKPPEGVAWATSVAEKHGVTYDAIKKRLGR